MQSKKRQPSPKDLLCLLKTSNTDFTFVCVRVCQKRKVRFGLEYRDKWHVPSYLRPPQSSLSPVFFVIKHCEGKPPFK
jgi:hypothetical protein